MEAVADGKSVSEAVQILKSKNYTNRKRSFASHNYLIAISCLLLGLLPLSTSKDINPFGVPQQTSRYIAAARAIAHRDPTNFYSEPLAELLAGEDAFDLVSKAPLPSSSPSKRKKHTIVVNERVVRTMIIDKTLEAYTNGVHAPKQVVIIGAGMDTRAHRLYLPGVTYYEIDYADVIELKEKLLTQAGINERDRGVPVKRICLDLSDNSNLDVLYDKLAEVGFERTNPAIYVMEGLIYYLTAAEVKQLFTALKGTPKTLIISSIVDANRRKKLTFSALRKLWKSDFQELKRAGAFGLDHWKLNRVQSMSKSVKALDVGVSFLKSNKGNELIVELVSK